MENIKNRTYYQHYKTFHNFSKEHYKHNCQDKKLLAEYVMCQRKEKSIDKFSCVKGKTPLTKCHASREGETASKSVMSKILTICHASRY